MTGGWAATNTLRWFLTDDEGDNDPPEMSYRTAIAVVEAALAALEACGCQHDLAESPCDRSRGLPLDKWCVRCRALRAVREGS